MLSAHIFDRIAVQLNERTRKSIEDKEKENIIHSKMKNIPIRKHFLLKIIYIFIYGLFGTIQKKKRNLELLS